MNGSNFLQVLTLLCCAGMLYFSYMTFIEARQIHEESQTLFAKADSLMSIPAAKSVAQSVAGTGTKVARLLDEVVSDLETAYKEAKKESAKAAPKVRVSSSYQIEDRYVLSKVYDPEFVGDEAGTIVIDVSVDKLGDVKKTSVNPATTITNEEVIEAARKAALKTDFDFNFDAPESQSGTITFTYTKK